MARKKSINDIDAQLLRIARASASQYGAAARGSNLYQRASAAAERYKANIRKKGGLEDVFQDDDYVGTMKRNREKKVSRRVYMYGLSNG